MHMGCHSRRREYNSIRGLYDVCGGTSILLPTIKPHTKKMAAGLTHTKINYVKKLVANMEKH